jgi:hypothetical protein
MISQNVREGTTFAVHNFLRVASKNSSTIFSVDVKLLGLWSEVLNIFLEQCRLYAPFVVCQIFVEERMHDFHRLVCQFVRFCDSLNDTMLSMESPFQGVSIDIP